MKEKNSKKSLRAQPHLVDDCKLKTKKYIVKSEKACGFSLIFLYLFGSIGMVAYILADCLRAPQLSLNCATQGHVLRLKNVLRLHAIHFTTEHKS